MSWIIHRCSECQHPDFYHRDNRQDVCSYGACPCASAVPMPPEVIPTWRSGAHPDDVEPLRRPACGCEACTAMYQREAV